MAEKIRVLLVDDQELIRVGFRLVLESEGDIEVVGEAGDGAAAITAVEQLHPDVVLMDVRMPGTDGIAATEAIARDAPQSRVLVLTTFDLDEYAFGAMAAGAGGFLLKDAQRGELISAVRAVHRGDAVLSPRVTRRFLEHLGPRLRAAPDGPDPTGSLTERERDVFIAIGQGLTNAEIAGELHLSESTVKTHVGRVLMKLEARDRIQAVILAHRVGVIP
ncbi:response regulator [Microbacterium sp.]|uniref:response regulator n=1 Tax=Microbacterium sp. TaxID=51671 RepID=UPI003F990FF0